MCRGSVVGDYAPEAPDVSRVIIILPLHSSEVKGYNLKNGYVKEQRGFRISFYKWPQRFWNLGEPFSNKAKLENPKDFFYSR